MQLFNAQFKKWLISIFTCLAFGVAQNISAQTTNSIPSNLFLTDNGFLFWYKSGQRLINVKKIKEAEKSPESRPAIEDPEGHWGQPTNGFQLSLRFEKQTFTNGEPIVAVMLIRNVTNAPLTHFKPTYVKVTRDGQPLKRKNGNGLDLIEITMWPETTLFPQTQHRYQENLNQSYDLNESGGYVFQAECKQPKTISQPASILITNVMTVQTP